MTKENLDIAEEVHSIKIEVALAAALERAQISFLSNDDSAYTLSSRLKNSIREISRLSQKAATGFTNIITCLAIKSALPDVDMRFHQVQIQTKTNRPAGFNFRGVSEKIIYPWLSANTFEGAKSGWQTRTFERPKPYMLSYDENIGAIKDSFLATFDEIEEKMQSAEEALAYILHLQLVLRESKKITMSQPRTKDIHLIVRLFKSHFFHPYKASNGASRLPVLALYAIYSSLIEQLDRYHGKELKSLEEHSAADSQTGAIGDIEVVDSTSGAVFEAIEVKHNIALNERIITDAAKKIMNTAVDRYYILTTHANCEPDDELYKKISAIKNTYSCQLIANGVIPSLQYYLRLLSDPSAVFGKYVKLLETDKAIKHEHREVWNQLAIS
jgi:DNA (cytosine-5)-methyltransferase 1